MRKEIIFIGILILVVILKLSTLTPAHEVMNNVESGSSGSTVNSEKSESNIVKKTNADELNVDKSDIDKLTVDEKSGESCNAYIPELLETGSGSYVLNSSRTIFDYFCSQTLGGNSYEQLDLSGYNTPPLIQGYFEDIAINESTYYVALTELSDELYLACWLQDIPEPENNGEWDQINCDISLVDSHAYFTPKKVLDEATNEFYLTDTEISGHFYSEYANDLSKIQTWYAENNLWTLEQFVQNTPTEEELKLSILNYNTVKQVINTLQECIKQNNS